jgi:hypothetical protein
MKNMITINNRIINVNQKDDLPLRGKIIIFRVEDSTNFMESLMNLLINARPKFIDFRCLMHLSWFERFDVFKPYVKTVAIYHDEYIYPILGYSYIKQLHIQNLQCESTLHYCEELIYDQGFIINVSIKHYAECNKLFYTCISVNKRKLDYKRKIMKQFMLGFFIKNGNSLIKSLPKDIVRLINSKLYKMNIYLEEIPNIN